MKKMMMLVVLAVLMLVTISFVSSINANSVNGKKESPLYKLRTNRAIGVKIKGILEKIKVKFFSSRIFYIPSKLLQYNEELNFFRNAKFDDTSYCTYYCSYWDKGCPSSSEKFCETFD